MTDVPTFDETDVLFLTVDSLRNDRVTAETMPYLHSLAEDGINFEQMISTAPATAASFVGIMASRYYADIDGIGLPDSKFTTLAEAVPREYQTFGLSTNQFTSSYYNYDRGFDQFDGESQGWKFEIRKRLDEDGLLFGALESSYQTWLTLTSDGGAGSPSYFNRPAEVVNESLQKKLLRPDGPVFAWGHYMDPHHPYEPPAEYLPSGVSSRGEAQSLSRELPGRVPEGRKDDLELCAELYDAECRHWDDAFADLHRSLPDDTLTVVVGDHGELLGEHDRLGHPHEMWDELVNVPCIIHHPDLPDKTITSQQSTIDLAPTLLDLLGGDVPESMRGSPVDLRNPAVREHSIGTIETPENIGMVRTPTSKWVRHKSRRSTQETQGELLFETGGEEAVSRGRERRESEPGTVRQLRDIFTDTMAGESGAVGRTDEDATVKRHLADLGYLEQR